MSYCRFYPIAFLLLLSACSESPESAIDDIADQSKDLVQSARDLADDASERVAEELDNAKDTASERVSKAVDELKGH
ncbi:hypothetical protein [Marinobacter similis]|uniref:Lipoprotein n=1 Tax=Marinobacter similis TaxID=1420916 RepID=W5YUG0_9GAMM|nr:hypothetical protein [Marinobacter similis]AHI30123.1 hypothetical protein AU14_12540 [Marinobacter similis]